LLSGLLGLDSSVLVRYLTQDDPAQSAAVDHLFETKLTSAEPGFVSKIVLCEVAWVLRRGYGFPRNRIHETFRRLLNVPELRFEDLALVERGLKSGHDLPDYLIHELGRAAGCSETVTFDRRFAKLDGVRLLGR
jgi:predicted nucleic-acid-binding protein